MRWSAARTRGRQGGLSFLALVAVAAGAVLIALALHAQKSAPRVSPSAAGTLDPGAGAVSSPASPRSSGEASPSDPAPAAPEPLPKSPPVRVRIPAIGISTAVFPIGKAPDGTLAVPAPGPNLNKAAWFDKSPTPGQPGPSIIEGHVDSEEGPSVFFKLAALRPGNKILVTRRDGKVVTFTVNAVRDFKKSHFPTALVYGGKDLSTPQLRLITCSDFDTSIGHHVGNAVVFTHLTHVQSPS